jgi:hypothetical protein
MRSLRETVESPDFVQFDRGLEMPFLIDLTDERFKIPANHSIIEYIRRANPSAHSDLGDLLIKLAQRITGAHYYCPNFPACAYVVLHTDGNLIFAIASGMWKFAFRLPPKVVSQAVADGTGEYSDIGSDWLLVDAFPRGVSKAAADVAHMRLCEAAFRYAEDIAANS